VSVSSSLPESTNIKYIEVWMISCLLLPFLEVLLQTYLIILRNRQSLRVLTKVKDFQLNTIFVAALKLHTI
jgi:hypothetical protein